MKLRHTMYVVALLLVALGLTACGSSATPTPTPKPTVPPAPTLPLPPTAIPATATSVPPTPSPLPPTATPVPAQATAKQVVNVRQGPGTQFPITGKMPVNAAAIILGKSEDGKWYQVAFPDREHPNWVSAAFVTVTGPVDTAPVIAVALPTATPTTAGGAAARTRTPTALPTQAFPAPKGVIGFVAYDAGQVSYTLNNVAVDSHAISGFKLLGRFPADLALFTNAAPFDWAPDGSGRVAWVFGGSGAANVLRVSDNAGNDRDLFTHQGVSSPTWAPNSQSIAYIGMDNNFGTQFIYTISPQGGVEQRLFGARTDKPESFRGVAWGKTHLLFVSNYTGQYEIWRLNPDGSGPFQLTNDKRENGSPAWSPDGTKFAYYSKQTNGSYQIMVANADGSGARVLTNAGNNFTPTWSPDGNWIAFASTRGGRLDIYMMDKNGNTAQLLTDKSSLEGQMPGSWR